VVWFGEAIPAGLLPRALDAADDCGVFLSVGTSAMVQPAAGLAQRAMQSGATLVEVNSQPTELSELADYVLRANSGLALPALVAALRARRDAGVV
jgi:NAD-dependent deacetylase